MAIKIYTKTGDKGITALLGGVHVPKNHIRIEAYGTIDELNSQIGVVNDLAGDTNINEQLHWIQDRLFTIGSHLATAPEKGTKMKLPDLNEEDIEQLETWVDIMDEQLPAMRSFIIPGGCLPASATHVARCVCRRAERICVGMQQEEEAVAELIIKYLNRLSDYLFMLSRYLTKIKNGEELPWRPRPQ